MLQPRFKSFISIFLLNKQNQNSIYFVVLSLISPEKFVENISNNCIILNMTNWIIDQCHILSYEIEICSVINSNENNLNRYSLFKNEFNNMKIDNLQSDNDYQLTIKIYCQAGDYIETISFQMAKDKNQMENKHQLILFIVILISPFLLTFIFNRN